MTQLKHVSTTDVVTLPVEAKIDDAIRRFQQHQFRHLPVVEAENPLGMVSIGDMLMAVGGLLSEYRVASTDATVWYAGPTDVRQIMSTDIVALGPDEPVAKAARTMLERKIGAVLLVFQQRLVGIVTETDYVRRFLDPNAAVPETCRQQTVADYMAQDVVTATFSEDVFSLLRKMGRQLHHLPVVEDGQLVGILSDHDIRQAMALDKIEQILDPDQRIQLMENYNAGRIMSKVVETTTPEATLAEVACQLTDRGVGALPVLDGHDLVGIITKTDVLRACVGALEANEGQLP